MYLTHRPVLVEATPYLYPSSAEGLAKAFGGMVDKVNGDLYLQTVDGIRVCPTSRWIVRQFTDVHIMTEAEVFEAFLPVNASQAYDVLGGRAWPGSELDNRLKVVGA